MICLTFDTDHMSNARMQEFLDTVPLPGRGTFFCTQVYECLATKDHELAPHPFLGDSTNWGNELQAMQNNFPQAKGWRSHSCVFSHILAEQLTEMGYQYVSTQDDLGRSGIQPHKHAWGIMQFPIYYMDNLDFSTQNFWKEGQHQPFSNILIEQALKSDGVYVFDFHPIHLLLNTPNSAFYFNARDAFLAGEDIANLRNNDYGTFDFYQTLCQEILKSGAISVTLGEANDSWNEQVKPHP